MVAAKLPKILEILRYDLQRHFPYDVIMPVPKGEKRPMMRHRGGGWTWAALDALLDERSQAEVDSFDWCIVLHDMCVVDVDSLDLANEWEAKFPELRRSSIRVNTTRGRHYYFQRPPIADELGYYDGAGQRVRGIDFKSVCRTGTGGIAVIPPSAGKCFVPTMTSPHFGELTQMSAELLDAVAIPRLATVDATLVFTCTERLRLERSTLLHTMSFFEPFLSEEDSVMRGVDDCIPVPCSMAEFKELMHVLEYHAFSENNATEASLARVLFVADLLGLSTYKRLLRSVKCGSLRAHVDLHTHWPEMAVVHHNETRRPLDQPLISIDAGLAEDLLFTRYAGRLDATTKEIRLYPTVPPVFKYGERVLRRDPPGELVGKLPKDVLMLMRAFPQRVIIAGGAVVGLVGAGVRAGNDIDVFIVGCGADEAQKVVELADDLFCGRRSFLTPNTITYLPEAACVANDNVVVQIVLRLYEDATHVLNSFDITASKVAAWVSADGEVVVRALGSWVECMRCMMFAVDYAIWNKASVLRALKYVTKGFDAIVPGIRRSALKPDVVTKLSASGTGVGALFAVEQDMTWRGVRDRPTMENVCKYVTRRMHSDYHFVMKFQRRLYYAMKAMLRCVMMVESSRKEHVWQVMPHITDVSTRFANVTWKERPQIEDAFFVEKM